MTIAVGYNPKTKTFWIEPEFELNSEQTVILTKMLAEKLREFRDKGNKK